MNKRASKFEINVEQAASGALEIGFDAGSREMSATLRLRRV
ncbi:MAG: hypothetical protein ABI614_14650 [Planctomycetota bacterium]